MLMIDTLGVFVSIEAVPRRCKREQHYALVVTPVLIHIDWTLNTLVCDIMQLYFIVCCYLCNPIKLLAHPAETKN